MEAKDSCYIDWNVVCPHCLEMSEHKILRGLTEWVECSFCGRHVYPNWAKALKDRIRIMRRRFLFSGIQLITCIIACIILIAFDTGPSNLYFWLFLLIGLFCL